MRVYPRQSLQVVSEESRSALTDGMKIDERLLEPLSEHAGTLRGLAPVEQTKHRHILRSGTSQASWIGHDCDMTRLELSGQVEL